MQIILNRVIIHLCSGKNCEDQMNIGDSKAFMLICKEEPERPSCIIDISGERSVCSQTDREDRIKVAERRTLTSLNC